ncbi:hypothetical protein PR048_026169 [Dryococelus australis]|uniref:Uncharacterized protein n=1 Tax=Dryococelus australis TaxID=614101 RepID=A0ABQ9GKL6_9NEOP|nr:hypothetical protein PR048_026169 [Dryococelus australis]
MITLLKIFACGNRAGRYRWSVGFLGDLPFPQPFHSSGAPYSPQSPSSALKTIDVKSRRNLFTLLKIFSLNFTVLYALDPASFLHWLLHNREFTPFLTIQPMTRANDCGACIHWRRVTPGVLYKVRSNDKRFAKLHISGFISCHISCPHSSGVGWPTCNRRVAGSRPGASDVADAQLDCRTGSSSTNNRTSAKWLLQKFPTLQVRWQVFILPSAVAEKCLQVPRYTEGNSYQNVPTHPTKSPVSSAKGGGGGTSGCDVNRSRPPGDGAVGQSPVGPQSCSGRPRSCSGQTTRLPPRLTGFDSRRGRPRIFARGNRPGRCHWSAGFLGDISFSSPLHSVSAP